MFYNWFLERVALTIGDQINGSTFIKNLREWRKIQKASEAELNSIQKEKLSILLRHAQQNVPFYRELNIEESDDPYTWIKSFPTVQKSTIKSNEDRFISDGIDRNSLIEYASSGSSGVQSRIWMNKKEQAIIRSILMLWWEWANYKIGKPLMQTGMTPNRGLLKSLKDILFRTHYYVAFGLSEASILAALNKQSRVKKGFLGGYASSLYVLAKTAREAGLDTIKFESAISWGDKMFPHYRKEIESVFGAKVYDTYACNEGIMIAAQKDLPYYYIFTPHVYLEILDDQGNDVPDGELGHVVVTRLDGFSMPLIRYYLGDLAVKLPFEKYPVNRELNFPLLERVVGRDTDIVVTPAGKRLIVHFFTGIFEFYPTIRQFRVIQTLPESIEIEYIPDIGFNHAVLKELTEKMNEYIDGELEIFYREVQMIPNTPSGKPQIIQSLLKKESKE